MIPSHRPTPRRTRRRHAIAAVLVLGSVGAACSDDDDLDPGDTILPGDTLLPGDTILPGDTLLPGDTILPGDTGPTVPGEVTLPTDPPTSD